MSASSNLEIDLLKLQQTMNQIQTCDTKTYSDLLQSTSEQFNRSILFESFISVLNTILLCKRQNIPSRTVSFVRRLLENYRDYCEPKEFFSNLIEYLLNCVESKTPRVRKNALFFIKLVLDLDSSLVTFNLLTSISERLFDREKAVRKEALRILCEHQMVNLNKKTKIVNLFKNIIRHDPSHEIRKLALQAIVQDSTTYNCIVDRCMDCNVSIRKTFYYDCLPNIDLAEISEERRYVLLNKAVFEREFDAKQLFVDKCISTWDLSVHMVAFVDLFMHHTTIESINKVLAAIFAKINYEIDSTEILHNLSASSTFLLNSYFTYVEETCGRDSLLLPDLQEFVTSMYQAATDPTQDIMVVKNLFGTLKFYDLFNSTSRKYIISAIYKLLVNNSADIIVEESIILAKKICEADLEKFVGSIIKKNLEKNTRMCLLICKHTMKHIVPFGVMHTAIIEEIVLPNIEVREIKLEILEIAFYYLLQKENSHLLDMLFSSINEKMVFMMCIDLCITRGDLLERLLPTINAKIKNNDTDVVIPLSKLLLSGCDIASADLRKWYSHSLLSYYRSEDDHFKQYCSIFFYEVFKEDSSLLLEVFNDVFEKLEACQKIFADQTLFWINNSKRLNGSQQLFYNICMHLLKSNTSRVKAFLHVLDRIEISNCWDSLLTKKILFLCSVMAREIDGRTCIGEIISRLMSVDDGQPIDKEVLYALKDETGL